MSDRFVFQSSRDRARHANQSSRFGHQGLKGGRLRRLGLLCPLGSRRRVLTNGLASGAPAGACGEHAIIADARDAVSDKHNTRTVALAPGKRCEIMLTNGEPRTGPLNLPARVRYHL